MQTRVLIGIVLIFQAIGSISLHKIIDVTWLVASISIGVIGIILLYRHRRLDLDSSAESGVDLPDDGSLFDNSEYGDAVNHLVDHHDWW